MALLEREPELARLADLLRAAHGGRGRVVLVAGEAGIGKTSLLESFARPLAAGGATRVLWGHCDPVVPARAFAPLTDLAAPERGAPTGEAVALGDALAHGKRDDVFSAFLALLRAGPRLRVVIFEDMHWADEATLDLLRVLGPRLRALPLLLVGTYRSDEVGEEHPLRLALGDLPVGTATELRLGPLSLSAVQALTADGGLDAEAVHATTGGNPFFVTEVVAGASLAVPETVRDAVAARLRRRSPATRETMRMASVLGPSFEPELLVELIGSRAGLDEALQHGLLRDGGPVVEFRHVLAQRAIAEALTRDERAERNRRVLAALQIRSPAADPGRLAHHALEAGAPAAVVDFAPIAAERAAALGAHRQAAAHLETALRFVPIEDDRLRASLLERLAREFELTDEAVRAVAAQEAALECWRRLGDRIGEGNCLRGLANFYWYVGQGDRGRAVARDAVDLLESVAPGSIELARAYAVLGQRTIVAGVDDAAALDFARRAYDLATALGAEAVAVDALTTVGLARIYMDDEGGWADLEESAQRALDAGLVAAAGRALLNLVETAKDLVRYRDAERYGNRTLEVLASHDFDFLRRILLGDLAEVALELGRWTEAERHARELIALPRTATVVRAKALTVLGRLAARRGEDPWPSLDQALAHSGPDGISGSGSDWATLIHARAEAAWLGGDLERMRRELEPARALEGAVGGDWWLAELAFWRLKAGLPAAIHPRSVPGFALEAAGRHREAADAWEAGGCVYRAAMTLAASPEEVDLRRALSMLLDLGAKPLATSVARRLRDVGAQRVARGPRATTRANPAGLTQREQEVLALVVEGLRNADIAARLVLSAKTVDHHVSAILRKLEVPDRQAARQWAVTIDAKDRESLTQHRERSQFPRIRRGHSVPCNEAMQERGHEQVLLRAGGQGSGR